MKLEHVGIWTRDLEVARQFYTSHFGCAATPRYDNSRTGFSSYFLSFPDGARIELMQQPEEAERRAGDPARRAGHLALSVGSESAVIELTARLGQAGVPVVSQPRRTGDGYFESVITDPDGNRIELTI